jgi:hypothetical protein
VVDVFAWNANTVLTPGAQQDQRYAINTAATAPVTNSPAAAAARAATRT